MISPFLVLCVCIPISLSQIVQFEERKQALAHEFRSDTVAIDSLSSSDHALWSKSLPNSASLVQRVNFEPELGQGNPQEARLAELIPILRFVRRWTYAAAMIAGRPPFYATPGEPRMFENHFNTGDGVSRLIVADRLAAVYTRVNDQIITINVDPPPNTCAARPGRRTTSYLRRIQAWVVTKPTRNRIFIVSFQ